MARTVAGRRGADGSIIRCASRPGRKLALHIMRIPFRQANEYEAYLKLSLKKYSPTADL